MQAVAVHPISTKPCKSSRITKRKTIANEIRKTHKWRIKSGQVRERDRYLCLVCLVNEYDTVQQYNYQNLSVHHIIPLAEDPSKSLDDDNLITVCTYHHRLAESGKIPRQKLKRLALVPPPIVDRFPDNFRDHTPHAISVRIKYVSFFGKYSC